MAEFYRKQMSAGSDAIKAVCSPRKGLKQLRRAFAFLLCNKKALSGCSWRDSVNGLMGSREGVHKRSITELHIIITSRENCVSGSVRAAAALCKILGQQKGCSFPTICGGMKNHDMEVKARFKTSKALSRALASVERVLFIEEARQPLNCDFSSFVKNQRCRIEISLCQGLDTWHGLPPSQQVARILKGEGFKHANPSVEIQIPLNKNGQVYFEGVGYVMVEELGMALKCKSKCIPGFVSFETKRVSLNEKHSSIIVLSASFPREGIDRAILVFSLFSDQIKKSKAVLRFQFDDEFEYVREISNFEGESSPPFLHDGCKVSMVA